jgi:agmatine/peptidylarginine deiminase
VTQYRIPAEWQAQDATILVWPTPNSDWSENLAATEDSYATLTKVIASKQHVLIICLDETHQKHVYTTCLQHDCNISQLKFICIATNDTWVRDYGPQFLKEENDYHYLKLGFNAWGEQYPYQLDHAFSKKLHRMIDFNTKNYYENDFIFEGGNLDINDDGILLTNLTCTLRNNPHNELTVDEVKQKTKQLLHANEIIGLQLPPLQGDDTGGHIDTVARFVNNNTIVYAASNGPTDVNHNCLDKLQQQLHDYNKNTTNDYQLVPIKMPKNTAYDHAGNILPDSYINFLFINEALLVPVYNDANDAPTLELFKTLCPDREVIGIDATQLIKQFGSLHCASLHIPQKALHESWLNSAK